MVLNVQTKLNSLIEQISHACVDLGLETSNDIAILQTTVRDAVVDAERMQSEATASGEELNNRISPDIQKHKKSIHQAQVELTALDKRLEELPGGSVEAGLEYVNNALERQAELVIVRDKLSKEFISFDTFEGLIRKGLQNEVYKKKVNFEVGNIT